MFDIISSAYAMGQAPGGGGAAPGGALGSPIFLMLIFVAIFYFLLIRPQQKQQKAQNQMRQSLKKGDRVITTGGMYGRVVGLDENTVTLEIGEKTRVKFLRNAVGSLASAAQEAVEPKGDGNKDKKK